MKKLAIIGGGIIGMTLANYIDLTKYTVTLFDSSIGQATKASAGIISPWLSKRRNKQWYQLAKDGAAFYSKLNQDFCLPDSVYQQTGTLILRKKEELNSLMMLAEERKIDAPEIGNISLVSELETTEKLPLLKKTAALYLTGGGKLNGENYLQTLKNRAIAKGIIFNSASVTLKDKKDSWSVSFEDCTEEFDMIALCAGAGTTDLLAPLNYSVDIRPQKGQLLVFETEYKNSQHWPVAMLDGESDLIPFANGQIIVGATHENDAGNDLTPTKAAFSQLANSTRPFLADERFFDKFPVSYRVGTRAYTADFAPFFNCLPNNDTAVVASGLGSSGLTTGPYIGYLLAQYLNTGHSEWLPYQKPIDTYIKI